MGDDNQTAQVNDAAELPDGSGILVLDIETPNYAEPGCCAPSTGAYEDRYLREQLVSSLIPQFAYDPLRLIGTAALLELYITRRV